jgi:putative protein-disulfide isomerase
MNIQAPARLLYITDPLCGWCYAQSASLLELQQRLPELLPSIAAQDHGLTVDLVLGGMVRGPRVGLVNPELANYILGSIPRLTEMTGQAFGTAFLEALEEGTLYSDSTPPCRAVAVARTMDRTRQVEYLHRVQDKVFAEARDLRDPEVYLELAQEFGFEASTFLQAWADDSSLRSAEADFQQVAKWGVQGFPMIVLDFEGQLTALCQGWASAEVLARRISELTGPDRDKVL